MRRRDDDDLGAAQGCLFAAATMALVALVGLLVVWHLL
jgi:hypothetical protein